ncbi:hypothetical protein HMPREF9318_00281 [Streptococcus urinalis FB127-CNA-2]|uniref:Sugar transport protein n=1 Tax=Streptococcus urinalis 2285-97 TaxID=764291 RepID=G5KFM0_9STRE|nr:GRP family sugar transporter [Streptococcus urinalis]EHJ56873.1 sugar transport protein [Streptococcus urinalis 2285-97]EKS22083.1 hypothetical protein HMPREF9318_00281 [Streptococcus urinalis FB127-CNA-2]VEF31895.1 glucose uptake protein [Streptococcus urinalis]
MSILLALLPAIGLGVLPLLLGKIGGKPINNILGFGFGSLIIGLIVQLFLAHDFTTGLSFWLPFLSGVAWIVGQGGQVTSFEVMGVSRTMPISTGLQLIGTSVLGVLFFGEWSGLSSKLFGFLAIAILILGAYLTTVNPEQKEDHSSSNLVSGVRILLLTSFGYWIFSVVPNMVNASAISIFFPQMLGIFTGAIVYAFVKDKVSFKSRESWLDGFVGLVFSLSSLVYIFSAQSNGSTLAFILSQLNVVISTLGAIFIMKEAKSSKQRRLTYIGLALIVLASVVTVFL